MLNVIDTDRYKKFITETGNVRGNNRTSIEFENDRLRRENAEKDRIITGLQQRCASLQEALMEVVR